MLDRNPKACQIVPPMAKSNTRKILVRVEEQEQEAHQILYSTSSSSSSSPHGFLSVCGCRPAIFTLTLLLSLLFTFSEASRPIIAPSPLSSSSPTNPPTPSPLKTLHGIHVDPIIVTLVITFSALLTSLIVIMALFKCFGFKLKRNQNRVGTAMDTTSGSENVDDGESKKGQNSVRKFSWDEIARFTNNFSTVIGSGGYSTVYLAHSPDSSNRFWAIKIQNGSERLNQVFRQELDILLRLGHQSIVKLLGYCDDREEGALVFEYVANGNLQEILHGEEQSSVLPWKNRMLIAYQIAQAIEYLHEQCAQHIVHMDIKASNVLLDRNLNSKLCDFGSAKMGFSSTIQPPSPALKKQFLMMGSPGYTDPHYMRTGFASKKNDVYSFGVLLLELVTGKEAFCPEKGQLLSTVVGPRLMDGGVLAEEVVAGMVDNRLGSAGGFDVEEARTVLALAATCLRQSPTLRPSVTQILQTITDRISSIAFVIEEESHHKSVKSYT
ncbi:probable receptor-like protein kinase At1g33260 [Argentina anserina]|uniref:probable receptor-like protein kinase At1g33260 n=1 Tax=Argentina anserina TaxID=57926 RepID=UPI0021768F73|nr:probable receptor-like protein kinase At1g33260 [Potentilla anserina]